MKAYYEMMKNAFNLILKASFRSQVIYIFDRLQKDRQVVHRVTTSDNDRQRVTTNDNEWCNQ